MRRKTSAYLSTIEKHDGNFGTVDMPEDTLEFSKMNPNTMNNT